jgi:hypothetical protein
VSGPDPLKKSGASPLGGLGRIEAGDVRVPVPSPLPLPDADVPLGAGLSHTKEVATSPNALIDSLTDPRVKYARQLKGEVPFDAASYAAVTGISIDGPEAQRLDALVKKVAARIGLDHDVRFAAETKYMGQFFEYAFLGLFHGWDRPKQPILIGAGLKAKSVEDIELLYRYFNKAQGAPRPLLPMFEDFLKLDEEQRIESILVHEKLELDAASWGSSNPHRSAVMDAPETDYAISDRVRRHLAVYAQCQEKMP